jgi:hypothetical protein
MQSYSYIRGQKSRSLSFYTTLITYSIAGPAARASIPPGGPKGSTRGLCGRGATKGALHHNLSAVAVNRGGRPKRENGAAREKGPLSFIKGRVKVAQKTLPQKIYNVKPRRIIKRPRRRALRLVAAAAKKSFPNPTCFALGSLQPGPRRRR